MRLPPFVWGHVGGALIVGAVGGAFLDLTAVAVFAGVLAASAAISTLVCWWRPGFAGAGWKLWVVGVLANPLFLAAAAWSVTQHECLLGSRTGWNCMFAKVGPLAAGICLPLPILGLVARWWRRRRREPLAS